MRQLPPVLPSLLRVLVFALAVMACGALTAATALPDLQPGQFTWAPEIAPSGPVTVVVSLPEQRAYVYRNGVRIGVSTVSSGRPGFDTPSGVYTILQKRREHYSNLYDTAPMPFMQRLTWGGVALHAGALPGYPASHGCVRLPRAFAEKLFDVTSAGTVVVVASGAFPPTVVTPGFFTPVDPATGIARASVAGSEAVEWFPERSPQGPLTVLLGTTDRALVVFRNGIEIGRAPVTAEGLPPLGTLAFVLLAGTKPEPSIVLPDQPALRWLLLQAGTSTAAASADALREALRSGQLVIPTAFARQLYELMQPGTTVVVTDEVLVPSDRIDVLDSEEGAVLPAPMPMPIAEPAE